MKCLKNYIQIRVSNSKESITMTQVELSEMKKRVETKNSVYMDWISVLKTSVNWNACLKLQSVQP